MVPLKGRQQARQAWPNLMLMLQALRGGGQSSIHPLEHFERQVAGPATNDL
jgi:hypothetical protein